MQASVTRKEFVDFALFCYSIVCLLLQSMKIRQTCDLQIGLRYVLEYG